jgi:hypothetical protein
LRYVQVNLLECGSRSLNDRNDANAWCHHQRLGQNTERRVPRCAHAQWSSIAAAKLVAYSHDAGTKGAMKVVHVGDAAERRALRMHCLRIGFRAHRHAHTPNYRRNADHERLQRLV